MTLKQKWLLASGFWLLTVSSARADEKPGGLIKTPSCLTILELTPATGAPESGKIVADLIARELRSQGEKGLTVPSLVERRDGSAYLESRRLVMPVRRDVTSAVAAGLSLRSATVLDGIVTEYVDGSASSAEPGFVGVEVALRLIDTMSRKVIWENTGRATSGTAFRFQRMPLADVASKAVRRALTGLRFEGAPTEGCAALGSTSLVTTAPEQAIIAQGASATAGGGGTGLRIVRTYTAPTGEKREIDITTEVRVLHFNQDQVELTGTMIDLIDEIASVMRDNADLKVILEGHTDADPKVSNEARFELSLKRSLAVYRALRVKHQIDSRRILVQAAGDRSPVAPNTTGFNRTLNRRVEFKFSTSATQ